MPDLTYSPPQPQDDDSELVLDHKTAVNISRCADAIEELDGANVAAIAAALGAANDNPGDPTVIGLLKQIAENTTPQG